MRRISSARPAAAELSGQAWLLLLAPLMLIALGTVGMASPFVGLVALAAAPTILAYVAATRLVVAGNLRLAKRLGLAIGLGLNGVFVASTLFPIGLELQPLFLLAYFLVAVPLIFGLGCAWATLERRYGKDSPHSPSPPWLIMGPLLAAPMATLMTTWPLYVYFLLARPTMDRMADQTVALARQEASPAPARTWIGGFPIVATRVEPGADGVALITDPAPSGPSGFVRLSQRAGTQSAVRPVIIGDRVNVPLWGGWSYRVED